MSILQGFFTGIRFYGPAVTLLFSRKFIGFLIFPFLLLVLLFWGGEWLVSIAGDNLSDLVKVKVASWVEGISWLEWLTQLSGFLIRILLKILYFFLFITFGAYLILIVMSPIYSWLSERTEAHITGKSYPFSIRQLLWEVLRGIGIAVRNMFFQLLITLLLLIFSFIPVIGLLSPFAMFFVSSYFYGFSFVDYAIERKRFNIRQSVKYINKNAGVVTGIGSVFALSLLVPCLSIFLCSLVSLLSVMAGALAVNKLSEGEENRPVRLKRPEFGK